MVLTRRRLLATALTGTTALAGCVGGCGQGLPLVGTNMPHDGEIAVDAVDTLPDDAAVVDASELPPTERSLVRTATERGTVRVCMDDGGERASALSSFSGRVSVESYLRDGETTYALWVRIEDAVYAGTADPPSSGPNPCCR